MVDQVISNVCKSVDGTIELSILIPVYANAEYLDDLLYSLILQEFFPNETEIVIRDDCSPEGHVIQQLYTKYRDRFAQRNVIVFVKRNDVNLGYVENKHRGIVGDCRGRYCLIADHDDFYVRCDAVKLLYQGLTQNKRAVVAYGCVKNYWSSRESLDRQCYIENSCKRLVGLINKPQSRVLEGTNEFKSQCLNLGSYQPIVTMFDRELALKRGWSSVECNDQSVGLLLGPENQIVHINNTLAVYRKSGGSVTSDIKIESILKSHTAIRDWVRNARRHIPGFSVKQALLWRAGMVITKAETVWGYVRINDRERLRHYFLLLRQYSWVDFLLQRYLSPTILRRDSHRKERPWYTWRLYVALLMLRQRLHAWLIGKIGRVLDLPQNEVKKITLL